MESVSALIYLTIALLILGVLIAFSPTILVTQVAILTKSSRPFINSLFFIAGVATPIIFFTLMAVYFIDPSARITIPQTRHILDVLPVVDILIGVLFIFGGMRVGAIEDHNPSKDKVMKLEAELFTPKKLYIFGCIKTATRLSGLALILMAAQLLKSNDEDGGIITLLGVIWFVIICLAPLGVLVILQRTDSKYFHKITSYSDKVASLSWRKIISIGLIAVGVIFTVYGLYLL